MIHRLRMARKRLWIARERELWTLASFESDRKNDSKWERWCRRLDTLRAIEQRKERIA